MDSAPISRSSSPESEPGDRTVTVPSTLEEAVALLRHLAAAGGPEVEHDYALNVGYDLLHRARTIGALSAEALKAIWSSLGPLATDDSLMGWVYRKPQGYAGDFKILDAIYCRRVSTDPAIRRWDEHFHRTLAVYAVRNRPQYLTSVLATVGWRTAARAHEPLRVLSIGAGPCREIAYALENFSYNVQFTCVDLDEAALDYARDVLAHRPDTQFIQANAIRLSLGRRFHVAWAAGLFDYLNDRLFVAVLRRLGSHLLPDGEVVVGNFGEWNPSRPFMEFGEWTLTHRTADQLLSLAKEAGFDSNVCRVGAEPTGVNLFLHAIPVNRQPL